MYSKNVGTVLGYKANDPEVAKKGYRYEIMNNMDMARGCKSGIAVIEDSSSMKCVQISHVKTDKDNYDK